MKPCGVGEEDLSARNCVHTSETTGHECKACFGCFQDEAAHLARSILVSLSAAFVDW